jgi:hypothetical protein
MPYNKLEACCIILSTYVNELKNGRECVKDVQRAVKSGSFDTSFIAGSSETSFGSGP